MLSLLLPFASIVSLSLSPFFHFAFFLSPLFGGGFLGYFRSLWPTQSELQIEFAWAQCLRQAWWVQIWIHFHSFWLQVLLQKKQSIILVFVMFIWMKDKLYLSEMLIWYLKWVHTPSVGFITRYGSEAAFPVANETTRKTMGISTWRCRHLIAYWRKSQFHAMTN